MAEGRPKLEFRRCTADHSGTCQPCQEETNRLTAFRRIDLPRWDALFMCDDCFEGSAAIANKRPSDA
jgi:hypothetical protein